MAAGLFLESAPPERLAGLGLQPTLFSPAPLPKYDKYENRSFFSK
ncbi:hypothetical protein [Agrobacterium sp. a22-2]|nr:hypothetical protein [Agrobacterium sp. a22-2]